MKVRTSELITVRAASIDDVEGIRSIHSSEEPEPHGRYLYLGMLQIHAAHQHKGVGRTMIEAGLTRARSLSCRALRTIPDEDTYGFYAKCGFKQIGEVASIELKVGNSKLPNGLYHHFLCV